MRKSKVVFCIPTVKKPYQVTLDSLEASLPLLDGYEHSMVSEVGCPYISNARATMLRKALDAGADIIVFIDHDLSWSPDALLKLIEADGDVVAGTYRFKNPVVEYMGQLIPGTDGTPIVRDGGLLLAHSAPAGFLKITRNAVNRFIAAYPELLYGEKCSPHIDLFNHGAIDGVWYGEDYAFCKRWIERCGELFIIPDLNLHHHTEDNVFEGNFHEFLLSCPGGSNDNSHEAS